MLYYKIEFICYETVINPLNNSKINSTLYTSTFTSHDSNSILAITFQFPEMHIRLLRKSNRVQSYRSPFHVLANILNLYLHMLIG